MSVVDPRRRLWNEQQKVFSQAVKRPKDRERVVELFLIQHAMVHTAAVSQSGLYSFEDELWQGLSVEDTRRIPPKFEHSIAWNIWHLTRIEDITMNLLVAGSPQILNRGGWLGQMKVTVRDTGSALDQSGIEHLSQEIDIAALRAYRLAVGRRTREVVRQLQLEQMKEPIEPSRLQQVRDEGAVVEAAGWLIDYWGGHTKAGLLLMPPTRHNLVHINEALRIKQKMQKQK